MRDWLPTLIALCGWHSLAFAVFHIGFWKLFGWPGSLRSTTYPNRAIIQILNLRLIWVLFGVAAALLLWPDDIVQTRLGRGLLGFMALFWLGRMLEQWIFLRVNRVMVHVLTVLFALGGVLFATAFVLAAQA